MFFIFTQHFIIHLPVATFVYSKIIYVCILLFMLIFSKMYYNQNINEIKNSSKEKLLTNDFKFLKTKFRYIIKSLEYFFFQFFIIHQTFLTKEMIFLLK